jgi:hypothetical protein
MFNTGTVVGVGANVFGAGFPSKHIPSFVWGGVDGFEEYDFEKMINTANEMYKRRNKEFSEIDKNILKKVFELTAFHRKINV